MHYKDSNIYKELTPRERKFFDDFVPASLDKKKDALDELETLSKMNKFKNRQLMVNLFESLDKDGNISPGRSNRKENMNGTTKDTFKKNAYRRWKRKGFIKTVKTGDAVTELVTLKGKEYEIVKEGKMIKLVSPGQQALIENKENGNERKKKTK